MIEVLDMIHFRMELLVAAVLVRSHITCSRSWVSLLLSRILFNAVKIGFYWPEVLVKKSAQTLSSLLKLMLVKIQVASSPRYLSNPVDPAFCMQVLTTSSTLVSSTMALKSGVTSGLDISWRIFVTRASYSRSELVLSYNIFIMNSILCGIVA